MNEFKIANRIAHDLVAKPRPGTLFEQAFFDIREEAKKLKQDKGALALTSIDTKLRQDIESKGFVIGEMKVSLGRFRGYRFVTSAKIILNGKFKGLEDTNLTTLLKYLQSEYSPKFKLKEVTETTAKFNVR